EEILLHPYLPGPSGARPSLPPGSVRPGSSLPLVETPALSSASASTSPSRLAVHPRGGQSPCSAALVIAASPAATRSATRPTAPTARVIGSSSVPPSALALR